MKSILEMVMELENNGGLTLKGGKAITYKGGYQVADFGVECKTAEEAVKAIADMGGNAGVWYSEGVYYIDHSFRVATRKAALEIGRAHNQQSVLKWATMELVWC